jgi:hypothetical protein
MLFASLREEERNQPLKVTSGLIYVSTSDIIIFLKKQSTRGGV